ncbi:Uncharacterised protein [Vibrio cholerae]|nr:Uncharacterised protein [Vibrio cholerae]
MMGLMSVYTVKGIERSCGNGIDPRKESVRNRLQ